MKDLNFRTATLEDLPTLLAFEQGIIATERPYNHSLKPDPINYYDLKTMIESTTTEVMVAVVEKEIIGSAYIRIKRAVSYLKNPYFAYLGFMYVKPVYRGKGINKLMIEELTNWARARNIKELRLDVYNDNAPALSAYEKAGFTRHLINMRLEI